MVKKILCIIGESGSGKSEVADYIQDRYNVPTLQSRTDRPKRTPNEVGHTFVCKQEFDNYRESDMIAFTNFGDKRYCCFKKDLTEENVYVIDEDGLDFLEDRFGETYHIRSIRIHCNEEIRKNRGIDLERITRDKGRFNKGIMSFDYWIDNDDSLKTLYSDTDYIVSDWRRK